MFYIDTTDAVNAMPTPSAAGAAGWFQQGNPITGVPYTTLTPDWANGVQAEILNVIKGAGLNPLKGTTNQLQTAISNMIAGGLAGQNFSQYALASQLSLYATTNFCNTTLTSAILASVTARGYITAANLAGYATQAFVSGNYYTSTTTDGKYLSQASPVVTNGAMYLRSNATPIINFQSATGTARGFLWQDTRMVLQLQRADDPATAAAWITLDSTGTLTSLGNIVANSDRKLKTNIHTITDALDKVSALRGVTYDRIDTGAAGMGLVAQEARDVIPELVHADQTDGTLSIAYGNIVGLLIEAVKELRAEVAALKDNQ